jgi:hypothetical protein
MKKIFTAIVLLAVCVGLVSCTYNISSIDMSSITEFEIIELATGTKVNLGPSDDNFDKAKTLLAEFQGSFKREAECKPEDGHLYQIIIYDNEKVLLDVTVNDDGSYCMDKTRYVAQDGTSAISVGTIAAFFAGKSRIITDGNMPYTPEEIERDGGAVTLIEHEGWTYFYETAKMSGKRYTLLAREQEGVFQILMGFNEVYGDRNIKKLSYVENSFEQSDENFFYFLLKDTETEQNKLVFFSPVQEVSGYVIEGPCSNMIIFTEQNQDAEKLGWIVTENAVTPIKLSDASVYEGMVCTVDDLGGLSEIGGSFFVSNDSTYDLKYVELTEIETYIIEIKVMEKSSTITNLFVRTVYTYDCLNKSLVTDDDTTETAA